MKPESDLKELLETEFPLRTAVPPDWNDVLTRARVPPERARDGASRKMTPELGGRHRLIPALAAIGAVAVAVLAVIAFWPSSSPGGGILQRALAAVGDGPIIHVVYRDQVSETLVDLTTGRRTSLADEIEEWYDPSEGLRQVTSFNGQVQNSVGYPWNAIPTQDQQTYAVIIDGYRDALRHGTAKLSPEQRFDGQDVYWVQFRGQMFPNETLGPQDLSHEIAINASTYRPIYVRQTLNGKPSPDTGESILTIQSLPAGSFNFHVPPPAQPGTPTMIGRRGPTTNLTPRIDTDAAARALGATPVWLGKRYANLPLAYAQSRRLSWGRLAQTPSQTTELELCYGAVNPHPILAGLDSTSCNETGPHVLLQETTRLTPTFIGWFSQTAPVTVPTGSILISWNPTDGYLIENGVYIHISAQNEHAVIAAAKALQQIKT